MKRIAAFLAAASTSLVLATTLLAQSAFPVRTVKIIVPFPGGGINDVLARILADKLAIGGARRRRSQACADCAAPLPILRA
jgi:tripartite-type tricarboxylate transporter receptor subunit TctC